MQDCSAPACAHPTIRSHGVGVLRSHAYDWLALLLLAAVEGVLNAIEPFHRFVGKGMMDTLLYPLKENTVPVWAVPILAVVLPMVIFTGIYMKRRNTYDLHHAILGLFFSVLITGVLTDAIKDGVGRPRPNFYWRCFPDGVPNYNNITGQVICHGDAAVIKEGHKSFPSGHTSWSFAGLGFLSWYLAGKIRVFDQRGHIAKLCIVIMPLLLAALVGVSRVDDYWHHWQDVFAGGILGLVVASFCYLQFFPSPSGEHGHWPHAYHHHILNPEVESQAQQTGASTSDRHQAVLPRDLSVIPYAVSMEMTCGVWTRTLHELDFLCFTVKCQRKKLKRREEGATCLIHGRAQASMSASLQLTTFLLHERTWAGGAAPSVGRQYQRQKRMWRSRKKETAAKHPSVIGT